MKAFLEEYGKVVLAGITGVLLMLLLLNGGAFMDAFDRLKPENPDVKNEAVIGHLTALAGTGKPTLYFVDPMLKTGEEISISSLVSESRDFAGNDLRGRILYYLEDGTRVGGNYVISSYKETTMKFRFYVEDNQRLYTERSFAITICDRNTETGSKEEEKAKWDIGVTPETVWASIRVYEEEGKKKTVLSLTGEGVTQYYKESEIPWNTYKANITECIIEPQITSRDVSYWFKDCTKLERVPDFHQTNVYIGTFQNCTGLKYGKIPMEAVSITSMYEGCTGITSISEVPEYVAQMERAFYNCAALRGTMNIKADPLSYTDCFYKAGSATNGISLKVYGTSRNETTVKSMVQLEYGQNRGANIRYIGILTE